MTPAQTDTPRVDAEFKYSSPIGLEFVTAIFARQLERELSHAVKAAGEALEAQQEAEDLRESVRKLVGEWKQKSSDLVDRWEGYSDDGDLRSARSIQDCATELEKLLAAHPEFK